MDSLADIAERLMAEFDGRRAPNVVSDVVRAAAQDLTGAPSGAWAEMVERAARQRLLELECRPGAGGTRRSPAPPRSTPPPTTTSGTASTAAATDG